MPSSPEGCNVWMRVIGTETTRFARPTEDSDRAAGQFRQIFPQMQPHQLWQTPFKHMVMPAGDGMEIRRRCYARPTPPVLPQMKERLDARKIDQDTPGIR